MRSLLDENLTWGWYRKHALINLMLTILLLGIVWLLSNCMQEAGYPQ